jgi:hypothetical protein
MLRNPALLLVPFAAACATPEGEYPSLAIRDAERIGGSFEPVAPEPYVPPATSAAVLGRLGELTGEAASAHRAFLAEAPGVRSAVNSARSGGIGSEAWARAQVALAGLQASRSRAVIALADIDRIYVDAATEGGEIERIATARDAVAGQVEEQNRVIDSLIGSLPR